MKFVYVDEHESEKEGKRYTSVTCSIFKAEILIPFRKDLVQNLSNLLFNSGADPVSVERLPVLHACDLPRDVSDDVKLMIVESVFKLIDEYSVNIVRVGYFDSSVKRIAGSREERIEFCISNCLWPTQSLISDEVIYVYELSYAAHRKFRSYNDAGVQELYWQSENVEK